MAKLTFDSSRRKCVSDFSVDGFSWEKLFSWKYLLKKTPRRAKQLISLVLNKILKIWDALLELINMKVQCSKNWSKIFFTRRTWSFWKWHRKGTAKATSKIEKFVYYIFTENICSAWNPIQVVVFCKHVSTLKVA